MKIRGPFGPKTWFRENFLTVITFAHTVKKLRQRAVRACMYLIRGLGLNPALLSLVIPRTINGYRVHPMVRTRAAARQEQQTDNISTIAGRLTQLPAKRHQPISQKLAAVLVPLFEDRQGTVRVWLTQRSNNLSSHQGELFQSQAQVSVAPHDTAALKPMLQCYVRIAGSYRSAVTEC